MKLLCVKQVWKLTFHFSRVLLKSIGYWPLGKKYHMFHLVFHMCHFWLSPTPTTPKPDSSLDSKYVEFLRAKTNI